MNHQHFKGKEALSHVIEARQKGRDFMRQEHGLELSGPLFAALDAAKESSILLTILAIIFFHFQISLSIPIFICIFVVYLFFKTGRVAILGWNRLERLHRMIEEERYEIEHHREQEKEELTALYQAKGFSGKLLEEVIDILMADDNRLLQIMLEEELGLGLEKIEHPLKQALGGFIGIFISGIALFSILFLFPPFALIILATIVISFCSWFSAHKEKRKRLTSICWNLALSYLCFAIAHFLSQTFNQFV